MPPPLPMAAAEGPPAGALPTGPGVERHGGNRAAIAQRLGCRPERLLDASASLVPFGPPPAVRRVLRRALGPWPLVPWALVPWALGSLPAGAPALRDYPDRGYTALRRAIAAHHGLDPAWVLPGNGAAELFTWAAREAAAAGPSLLPVPGFADYGRALACWGGAWESLPLPIPWSGVFPAPFPWTGGDAGDHPAPVLWVTNPHNPTGQLWSRSSLEPLLERCALVIADEAFLPLVPGGEAQSLLPLLERHANLVVIRSLTKLCAIAGLRLGYALAAPDRLSRWSAWRDPWPVNGLAAAAGEALLGDRVALARWTARVQRWTAEEGTWLAGRLAALPGLAPLPSAANFLLVRGEAAGRPVSLEPLRRVLEERHRILLRDCRSFAGLGENWLRIALQGRRGNRRIVAALEREGSRGA